jgi:hypothetical protein
MAPCEGGSGIAVAHVALLIYPAKANGFKCIQNIMRKIKKGKCPYDYIEIMACPKGKEPFDDEMDSGLHSSILIFFPFPHLVPRPYPIRLHKRRGTAPR